MNKVYVLPANEDWIVDRFVKEWNEDNHDITSSINDADVIWLLASWCWNGIPLSILEKKKVLATIHHIVPDKFNREKLEEFLIRDKFVTAYHVYNQETYNFVEKITNKPIHLIDYWANQKIWKLTGEKKEIRKKYRLPEDKFLVGSFQRDTEGSDLKTPKLEKGPDLLVEFLQKIRDRNLHVVLAGWRRQYVICRLEELRIQYSYFEKPDQATINDLYQTLDLYPVTSRCEGGPQSLIECGLLGVNVVSRDIGIAKKVLKERAINNDVSLASPEIPNVDLWKIPAGYSHYRNLIESL